MFDTITINKLNTYVYALVNPATKEPFYIGKGIGNRVFTHKNEVISQGYVEDNNHKKIHIREILDQGFNVEHVILRHGLSESEAFLVESVMIDYLNYTGKNLENIVLGHKSNFYGIKTTDEIIRQYNAPKLDKLLHDVIIININKKYATSKSSNNSIYEATKQSWVIGESRRKEGLIALSEFQGIIIGVFKIQEWYPVETANNKKNNRWGFNAIEATDDIKDLYYNKSILDYKKRGAANPIRYRL
jgi:hypothetical protein